MQQPMYHTVTIQGLTKCYNKQTVLNHIDACFTDNQITGIIGRNGSGKTVLMRTISGLCKPTQGTVAIDGKIVGKDMEYPPSMGLLLEAPGFLPGCSGYKNLQYLSELKGEIHGAEIKEAMRMVGLDPEDRKKVSKYSMGMRQRLGIAQALMERPSLLMLDEPFNSLDKKGVLEMRQLIASYRSAGRIILLCSHNPVDIDELCDCVYEIDAGAMVRVKA